MSDEWDWELTDSAKRQFDGLDDYARERVVSKLDEVVGDQWREPDDYLEPLAGVPHQKLRVGPFRVGCRLSRDEMVLWVLTIKKRGVTPTGATTNVVSHRLLIRDVSWDDDLLVRKPRNSIYGLTDTLCF